MAWNEPGGGNRDPWSGGGRDPGPPDLDELIRRWTGKLGALLGGRGSGPSGPGDNSTGTSGGSGGVGGLLGIGLIIAVVGWLVASIYIVNEGERGVVLRFGKYLKTTLPGPHIRLFPIDRVQIVNLEQRRFREIGYRSAGTSGVRSQQAGGQTVLKEALMLTQDENIVDVRIAVQYQISDPRAYLFNVQDPESVLVQVVESAARETVGKSSLDFVLTEGRANLVADIKTLSQKILDDYGPELGPGQTSVGTQDALATGAGLQIVTVVLQDAQAPEEVQDAFADAIKAREDEQRFKNEAEAYANEVIPRARGQAARRLQEAAAYREQVVAEAQGEAGRFDLMLVAYEKAPEITRERLYLETVEAILARSSKVLVDVKGTNNLMYLPLDRWLKAPTTLPEEPQANRTEPPRSLPDETQSAAASRTRDLIRSREVR